MKTKLVLLGLVLSACASAPKSSPTSSESGQAKPPVAKSNQQSGIARDDVQIDIEGLKRSLGLDRSRMNLGYREVQFNTCTAGFGYTKNNCRQQTFVAINFRLQCRDSIGTTSEIVTSANVDPISNKQVKWQLGSFQSTANTDDEGYAQVAGIFAPESSPRTQRFKITVGTQFVYLRAGEVTRVVTPSNFCQ